MAPRINVPLLMLLACRSADAALHAAPSSFAVRSRPLQRAHVQMLPCYRTSQSCGARAPQPRCAEDAEPLDPSKDDLWAIVGAPPNSKLEDIRRAYRRRARMLHPDVSTDPDAPAKFRRLVNAFENSQVLRCHVARAIPSSSGATWTSASLWRSSHRCVQPQAIGKAWHGASQRGCECSAGTGKRSKKYGERPRAFPFEAAILSSRRV